MPPIYANGHISLQRVIRSTSCLVLGWVFRERLIERRYLRFERIQDGVRRHVGKNFKWPYLRNRSSDPLHVWLQGGVFGYGGSNGAIFDSNKFKMAAAAILDNFEWAYLRNDSRSTYIARIARSSLRQHSFLVILTIVCDRNADRNVVRRAATLTLIIRRSKCGVAIGCSDQNNRGWGMFGSRKKFVDMHNY